jgi:hypothetical protein
MRIHGQKIMMFAKFHLKAKYLGKIFLQKCHVCNFVYLTNSKTQ